ncbi:MAG: cytochrome c-type biogenesis protein [Anaerolineales bacterium]
MKGNRLFFLFLALVFLGLLFPLPALAQQATPSDDEVNAIARRLFCPVCENTPLDVCPTEACRQWRELIRQMLAEGKSETEIIQFFVDNYGARVLAEPPRQGINWIFYLVPPLAFLTGLFLFGRGFREWRRKARQAAVQPPPASSTAADEYAVRLEEELRKRR